jgi:hypothetical protein
MIDAMVGSLLLIAILLAPVPGWMLLRPHLAGGHTTGPLGHARLVYIHWSVLALFTLFAALDAWSASQLLALAYLALVAAPGALVASFIWRQARKGPRLERTLWWATATFAPTVALVLALAYVRLP